MLQQFTRLLICFLALTAPLSFTVNTCPDFKPVCEMLHTTATGRTITVGHRQQVVTISSGTLFGRVVQEFSSTEKTPSPARTDTILQGRAPPGSIIWKRTS